MILPAKVTQIETFGSLLQNLYWFNRVCVCVYSTGMSSHCAATFRSNARKLYNLNYYINFDILKSTFGERAYVFTQPRFISFCF